jgi:hypothetical protein
MSIFASIIGHYSFTNPSVNRCIDPPPASLQVDLCLPSIVHCRYRIATLIYHLWIHPSIVAHLSSLIYRSIIHLCINLSCINRSSICLSHTYISIHRHHSCLLVLSSVRTSVLHLDMTSPGSSLCPQRGKKPQNPDIGLDKETRFRFQRPQRGTQVNDLLVSPTLGFTMVPTTKKCHLDRKVHSMWCGTDMRLPP